jgi:uncharacterized protein (UPF0332 family)
MKEETNLLLFRAEEAIESADILLKQGLSFSKHGNVHGAFGEHYVKTGIFDKKYHKWLLSAFSRRIASDYDAAARFQSSSVKTMIDQAWEFLQAAKKHLVSQL